MPRPRSNRSFIDRPDRVTVHVRGDDVHFGWVDPRDGKEKSLKAKNDRALAYARARQLNSLVDAQLAAGFAVAAPGGPTLADFVPVYLKALEERGLAQNTRRSRKSLCGTWVDKVGDQTLEDLSGDVRLVAGVLRAVAGEGKNRTAVAMRSCLIDIWREAQARGAIRSDLPSPASIARAPKAKVRRARLTLDDFLTIYEVARRDFEPRVANAMALGLVTAQRRQDVALMQFKRGRDWLPAWMAWQQDDPHPTHPYPFVDDECLHIIQLKTGALVRIPLDLRLEAVGWTVREVVAQCRDRVASRFMVHHTHRRTKSNPGDPVHQDTISRSFADARDAAPGLAWPGKTPPTFHEIRSLAERLYREQGVDVQHLLGHREARMTQVYDDYRGAAWREIKA